MRLLELFSVAEDAALDIDTVRFAREIFDMLYDSADQLPWNEEHGIYYVHLGDILQSYRIGDIASFDTEPPPWIDLEHMDDLAIILAPEQTEMEVPGGGKAKTVGGFGYLKSTGQPVIMMNILHPEKPQEYVKSRLSGQRKTFVHEFIHFLDSKRGTRGKSQSAAKMDQGDVAGYFLNPTEFNAHFQEVAESIWSILHANVSPENLEKVRAYYLGNGFEGFYEKFKKDMPSIYHAAFTKYRKKVARRVYKLYQEIVSRLQQPTTEGMDNAFFLSRDHNLATAFPLPSDATEYKNINSKKRGAPKRKVRKRKGATDPNSFERMA